jgi:hypothetical protein
MEIDEKIILLSDAAEKLQQGVELALMRLPSKVSEAVSTAANDHFSRVGKNLGEDYKQVFENLKTANSSVLKAYASVKSSADWLGVKVLGMMLVSMLLIGLLFGGLLIWYGSSLESMRQEKAGLQAGIDALHDKGAGYLTNCGGKLCAALAKSDETWTRNSDQLRLYILKPLK